MIPDLDKILHAKKKMEQLTEIAAKLRCFILNHDFGLWTAEIIAEVLSRPRKTWCVRTYLPNLI